MVNAKTAWATSQPAKGYPSRLFVSVDGGESWRGIRLPCGNPYAFHRPLVSAVSARRAWLLCLGQPAVGQQNKALYETTDGRSWALRKNLSGSGYGQRLAFSATGFGLLAESRGGLLITRNGGRSWQRAGITSPEEAEPQSIALFASSEGLVLVRDDRSRRKIKLFKTLNAGRSWRVLHTWR